MQILTRDQQTRTAIAFGTGYRVRHDIVLTADHVVPEHQSPSTVTVWRHDAPPRKGTVVWRGTDLGLDLALVQVPGTEAWPRVADAAWGTVDREAVSGLAPFRFLGYPEANAIADVWNIDDRQGEIPVQTYVESDLFACDVRGAPPERVAGGTLWAGASGSAVFAEGVLVGVVIEDPVRVTTQRVIAVPLWRALADEVFGDIAAVRPSGPFVSRPATTTAEAALELGLWWDRSTARSWALGVKQAFEADNMGVRLLEGDLSEGELLRWNRLAPQAKRFLAIASHGPTAELADLYASAQVVVGQRDDLQLAVLAPDGVDLPGIDDRHLARFAHGQGAREEAAQIAVQLAAGLHALGGGPTRPWRPGIHRGYKWLGNFVGRVEERRGLSRWMQEGQPALCVLQAMGGTGKSALAWYWLMSDVLAELPGSELDRIAPGNAAEDLDGAGWYSFYGADATTSQFLDWMLERFDPDRDRDGERDRVEAVLDLLRRKRLVVVMDGLERELRAYRSLAAARLGEATRASDDFAARTAVDPALTRLLRGLTGPALRSKVLVTSRLLPSDLDEPADVVGIFRRVMLADFEPQDVVQLYRRFFITGSDSAIIAACRPYGFHPLTVRLLAGLIVKSLKYPGDIRAAPRYDPVTVADQRTRVLADSYDSLLPNEATVLERLAACRSGIRFEFAYRISGIESDVEFEEALAGLIGRGLVMTEPDASRFDLHPIVRHYAYGRLVDRVGLHRAIAEELEEQLGDVLDYLDELERTAHQFQARKADLLEFFHQLVSLGALYEAAELLTSGLEQHLELSGEFEEAVACFELLLARPELVNDELDADTRVMLRWMLAQLSLRMGNARTAIDTVELEFGEPEWVGEPDPENELAGTAEARRMLAPIRLMGLWFLGEIEEAKAGLHQVLSDFDEDDVNKLGPMLALMGYHLADGELGDAREMNQGMVDISELQLTQLVESRDADDEPNPEVDDLLLRMRAAIDVQRRALTVFPDSLDQEDFDATEVAALLGEQRRVLEQLLTHPETPADTRLVFEQQLTTLTLQQLRLGTALSISELDGAEAQLRHVLEVARRAQLVLQEVNALSGLGAVLARRGKLAEARDRTVEAMVLSDGRRFCAGSVNARTGMASIAIMRGDGADAERWEREARQLAEIDGVLHFAMSFDGLRRLRSEVAGTGEGTSSSSGAPSGSSTD